MHQTKKGSQWHFGMKAHIGVDEGSGLVHPEVGTAANVADVAEVANRLHGKGRHVFGDAGYIAVTVMYHHHCPLPVGITQRKSAQRAPHPAHATHPAPARPA